MVVVQADLGELLADRLGLAHQLFGGLLQLTGLAFADMHIAAQLAHRHRQAGQTVVVARRAGADLFHLVVDVHRQFGNVMQEHTRLLDLGGGLVQFAGLLLDMRHHRHALLADIADHLADFLGGAGGTPGQVAHLVGDHGETAAQFTGAGRFDGRVERQQVGLAGDGLNHLGDLLDLLGAGTQAIDQFAAGGGLRAQLLHAADRLLQRLLALLAGMAHGLRRFQGLLGALGVVLFGVGDGLRTLTDLLGGQQLRLQLIGQLFHRVRHLGGGQGVMAGMFGKALAQAVKVNRGGVRGTALLVAALPRAEPGPQGQQQQRWDAHVQRHLDLAVRHHQGHQPHSVQRQGNRVADIGNSHK